MATEKRYDYTHEVNEHLADLINEYVEGNGNLDRINEVLADMRSQVKDWMSPTWEVTALTRLIASVSDLLEHAWMHDGKDA